MEGQYIVTAEGYILAEFAGSGWRQTCPAAASDGTCRVATRTEAAPLSARSGSPWREELQGHSLASWMST